MRTLNEIAKFLGYKDEYSDKEVEFLEGDSRLVSPSCVFVALRGTLVNGVDFVRKAEANGAMAVICQAGNMPTSEVLKKLSIPVFEMPEDMGLGLLASWFYHYPSETLKVIGVTGTNGKSTIANVVAQWLSLLGHRCGVLGTLGNGFLPNLTKSANTTLDALQLQRTLAQMLKDGAEYVAMEVSSIGVVQGRVDNVRFVAGGFTNLTRDHLDFHGTMKNYADAKEKFLSMVDASHTVINVDNETGKAFSLLFRDGCSYSTHNYFADSSTHFVAGRFVSITDINYSSDGVTFEVDSNFGSGEFKSRLLGAFNVENLACAIGLLLSVHMPFSELMRTCREINPVKGRMEIFKGKEGPSVVVDYAHTPDGVEQVLRGARIHHPKGSIWCVLGCGGDRDKGKRPIMAIKASVFADHAVFTSDNPRTEDPQAILKDMELGVANASNITVIEDRRKAIEYAFEKAGQDDCVVIAGKGHEDYQIFKDRTIHFSDREIAAELCGVKCD
ncbi:MAG TPA: UDP-N-acetylmuramoyl-L-alanyl-D-glutamate--2,6-diaminopimelate ligase [Succinivibrionaceae bacterium]|nr:UDP-N-acetylmuramoyl-L-alanyl-D-glutamate--2,6-diaminopimelate ligase [Succinivibrionaceae bacterium]